ncbi:MAG: secretion protein HlyD [Burkholderiales bacterium RIFCSPHIGHO2_12_FULL_69_20]|nr:MAG: secretion protein HlyD [Burkholderiales bacterium RIFCSPHIGHO2_12_FULL_69_20]
MSGTVEVRPLPAPHPDPDRGPRRTVAAMVVVVALFITTALVWATVAELDVAVQARGAVIPPSRLQEVQSLEGGIVEQMLVAPGQTVKKGQLLARLDTAQYTATLGESRQQQLAALAGRARLDALMSGRAPVFEDAWRQEAPELIAKETQLWRDGLREYQSNSAVAREGVVRRRGELAEAQARITQLQAAVTVGEQSFAIEERLFKEGAGARADYLSAQQKLMGQKAELDGLRQSLPRLQAGLAEAQATAAEADARARSQWGGLRSEYETRAAALASTLTGQQDRVTRREVLSPVDGVVNRVLVPTIGGVVAPAKAILEIVPEEATLLMNARIKPSDIGFIRAGQQAHVRVLAYDASTYGKLEAKVERVGADAVVDEKGEPYFEVQLSAARGQLLLHGKPLPITPGMPVDIGILTGQRSVMQYLLKPVLRSVQGALQER